jgi:hypothetical protein
MAKKAETTAVAAVPFPEANTSLAAAVTDNVIDAYAQYGQKGMSSFIYGKFVKGDWEMGAEGIVPADTDQFAVNPLSIQKGAICWKAGRPADELMFPVGAGSEINLDDLPDHGPYEKDGDGWSEQAAVNVRDLQTGTEIVLKGSSRGFLQMIYKLSGEFANKAKTEGKAGKIIPIVRLSSDSYKHDDYGKVHTPLMEIEGWATEADLAAGKHDLSAK